MNWERLITLDCGCRIEGSEMGEMRVDFCALHVAAPKMLAALEKVEWEPADQIKESEHEPDRLRCPWCKQWMEYGHSDDCERETNIAAARGE